MDGSAATSLISDAAVAVESIDDARVEEAAVTDECSTIGALELFMFASLFVCSAAAAECISSASSAASLMSASLGRSSESRRCFLFA